MPLQNGFEQWDEELNGVPGFPEHMSPIGKFTYLRTYSRYLEDEGRREMWKETVSRASRYNVGLHVKHAEKIGIPVDMSWIKEEAKLLFTNQYNLRQALSGRTLWVGGADNGVADKFPLANFNCSFTNIENFEDLAELFYLLLVGTGVGFKCTPGMARKIPAVRDNFNIVHDEYRPLPKWMRTDETALITDEVEYNEVTGRYDFVKDDEGNYIPSTTALIGVGDAKEGWVDALRKFFMVVTEERYDCITEIRFNYDSVRKAGEKLRTFGGTASGHEPLLEMFDLFEKVIKNTLDDSLEPLERVGEHRVKLRPIHIADMANGVGYNVVVGGVENRLAPR